MSRRRGERSAFGRRLWRWFERQGTMRVAIVALGVGLGVAILALFRLDGVLPPVLSGTLELEAIPDAGWPSGWGPAMSTAGEAQLRALRELEGILVILTFLGLAVAGLGVAGLGVARAIARSGEAAIRAALGATTLRLVRERVVDCLLVLALGTAAGAGLGAAGAALLRRTWPHGSTVDGIGPLDPALMLAVLGTLGVSVFLEAFIFVRPDRPDSSIRAALSAGRRSTSGPREGVLRDGLAIVQISLSLALVVSAGLLVRHAGAASTGLASAIDPADTMKVSLELTTELATGDPALPPDASGGVASRSGALAALLERTRGWPEVTAGTLSTPGFWAGAAPVRMITTECGACAIGGIYTPMKPAAARHHAVAPGFFRTAGMSIVRGRGFSDADLPETGRMAVVNRTLAADYFENGDAIGRRIHVDAPGGPVYTVVGIVGEEVAGGLGSRTVAPALYVPVLQVAPARVELALETAGGPAEMEARLADAARAIGARITDVTRLDVYLERQAAPVRWLGRVLAAVALAVLVLALRGLIAVARQDVDRRRREIGVRAALGARPVDIVRLILARSARQVAAAAAVGFWLALLVAAALRLRLPEAPILDPPLILGVLALLGGAVVMSSTAAARNAARVRPAGALRDE